MADPGAYSVYCNDGFTLAELIVEAVSGMDFMDYVDREILDLLAWRAPLRPEMTLTPAAWPRPIPAPARSSACRLPERHRAGGLYATASDLALGGALTGSALLKESSLEAMAYPEYSRGIWPEDTLDSLATAWLGQCGVVPLLPE